MLVRLLAISGIVSTFICPAEVFAQEGPCAPPESFQGYWGAGQVQVRERVAGIPVLATSRFSYRQMRYSPCASGTPVLPPGVGEASISVGIPLFDNRRGGWILQMAARGQGSQRPSEPVSGIVTGAPATAGHLNLWETPLPLIQLTGAASAAILPWSRDVPLSIAYLGGIRVYAVYLKHAQANLGFMVGGTNVSVDIVPSFAFRGSDLTIRRYRMAIGFELRSPITFSSGPVPLQWRLWGALTLALEKLDEGRTDRVRGAQTQPPSSDLVRSPPEAAPPAQTAWEMTL
ncbi:hypothetical protein [Polyangium jinanense]|uniref:Uncharacterized protein n=1 Tax=Polyangium jinanense TaxID=2829994 RepID=A0A9X3X4S2_9BACT|nr:hypothetical protein [Polyangium jinanense]MDC3954884.1 hypothetical protein [Polyangium jinanense]MDC3981346.1 hypothetical protein [Polyangium jinanense]